MGCPTLGHQSNVQESDETLPIRYSQCYSGFFIQDKVEVKEIFPHQTKYKAKFLVKHVVIASFIGSKPLESLLVY